MISVFLHIPKTAGSSILSLMENDHTKGIWCLESDLWKIKREELLNLDLLAGHFTLRHLYQYLELNDLDRKNFKIYSVVREPLEHLLSLINYPRVLAFRNEALSEEWMTDMLTSGDNLQAIKQTLLKYKWLLSLQRDYLVNTSLQLNLGEFAEVGIFPNIDNVFKNIGNDISYLPEVLPHKNQAEVRQENEWSMLLRDFLNTDPEISEYLAMEYELFNSLVEVFGVSLKPRISNCTMISGKSFKDSRGLLVAWEDVEEIGFPVRRVYTVTDASVGITRGFHAHRDLKQLMICTQGSIKVSLETSEGEKQVMLDNPEKGLRLEGIVWRTFEMIEENSTLVVLASEPFNESDYIHDYSEFKQLVTQ